MTERELRKWVRAKGPYPSNQHYGQFYWMERIHSVSPDGSNRIATELFSQLAGRLDSPLKYYRNKSNAVRDFLDVLRRSRD